jgi:lysophospholipase L1-like esterase
MSHDTPVRPRRPELRAATAAAYAGGAVSALGALGLGVLLGQAWIARLTIPGAEAPPPRAGGGYGGHYDGKPLRLAVIGDSTAAGYGVRTRAETPGALLATWIADAARRPVRLTCPAVVGSVSAWLSAQVETALEAGVDLAIIFIGANDVTTGNKASVAAGQLAEAVRMLRAIGAEVVVATCPDLGTVRPIRPPLRWVARRWSRQLAAAQTVAAVNAGARTVSLADLLGPQFDAAPDQFFGEDRFHPSAEGYRAAAAVVLPSALAAIGIPTVRDGVGPTEGPLALPQAAVTAAHNPGTEVRAVAAPGTGGRALARLHRLVRGRSGGPGVRGEATPSAPQAVPSCITGAPTAKLTGHLT